MTDEPTRNAQPDYRPIAVLFQQLPSSGRWTASKRQRWLAAIERNLDLVIEVVEEEADG